MSRRLPRPGFTPGELLVVVAILAVVVGLLASAIQRSRLSDARARCWNNLHRQALAFREYHDTHNGLPPGVGRAARRSSTNGTGYFHILPYIEQEALFKLATVNGVTDAANNDVCRLVIGAFVCPSDPSTDGKPVDGPVGVYGPSCYAGNAQVFCEVDADGRMINQERWARFDTHFGDGLSNTILIAEKYARCTTPSIPQGGCFWAYDTLGLTVQPYHPAFAANWTSYCIGETSLFKLRPQADNCDPTLASGPHSAMHVALADAGVRSLSPRTSGKTWWGLCTPAGGEELGLDW